MIDINKIYSIKKLRKLLSKPLVKKFLMGNYVYKDTGRTVKCQIKNCSEKVSWIISDKNNNLVCLCFGHGEEI